jgi:hypothetical protein
MRTLSMRIVTYLIEYLGEFEFISETILDYESGDQMGSVDVENPPSKISCLGTFKYSLVFFTLHYHAYPPILFKQRRRFSQKVKETFSNPGLYETNKSI